MDPFGVEVVAHPGSCSLAAGRERSILVAQTLIAPARFGVTQQPEAHRSSLALARHPAQEGRRGSYAPRSRIARSNRSRATLSVSAIAINRATGSVSLRPTSERSIASRRGCGQVSTSRSWRSAAGPSAASFERRPASSSINGGQSSGAPGKRETGPRFGSPASSAVRVSVDLEMRATSEHQRSDRPETDHDLTNDLHAGPSFPGLLSGSGGGRSARPPVSTTGHSQSRDRREGECDATHQLHVRPPSLCAR